MACNATESTARDRTRRPGAKDRTRTRRAARIAKSARIFLCIAFPADPMGAPA